ncbi:hypothetical protein RHMOL_Rhmol02G0215200 [Rhododendron molle]|uniref:Uncharacterized protein n=1 Tax=Rhododendron molle TaxID=49168 RepID=A0ACC0PVQ2_RHOML|nr:hypothetical protein RHMOL_Rhmol02G0215200 [Rhododendron molle]
MSLYLDCNSSGTKWRTPSSGIDALSQSMTNILETMILRQNQYISVVKHRCNMVDIMKILGQMEYFQQEFVPPVYWWLIDYLSVDPMKLDVFYGLRNDEQRIAFVQQEHTKAMLTQSRGQDNPTESLPPWYLPLQI